MLDLGRPLFWGNRDRPVNGTSVSVGRARRIIKDRLPALASSTTISQDTPTRPGLKYTSAAFFDVSGRACTFRVDRIPVPSHLPAHPSPALHAR